MMVAEHPCYKQPGGSPTHNIAKGLQEKAKEGEEGGGKEEKGILFKN